MTFPYFEPSIISLLRYSIAKEEDVDSLPESRDVFVGTDDAGSIRIWGETADRGPCAKKDLCSVFLEYSLYCASWCNAAEARYHMGRFGEKLGHHLASYLKANPSILNRGNPAIGALERLFGSIGACYRTDSVQGGLRFRVTECPLDEAARRAGVQNLDLARFGINEMCRSLLLGLNPALIVTTSPESSAQFLFTLREAVTA